MRHFFYIILCANFVCNAQNIHSKYIFKNKYDTVLLNYSLQIIEEIDDDELAEKINTHVLNYSSLMLQKADSIYRKKFLFGLAQAYNNKGYFLNSKKLYKEALLNYFKSIAIMKEYAFNKTLGEVYINIANLYQETSNLEISTLYYKEAFRLLIKNNNKYSAAIALTNMSYSSFSIQKYDDAINFNTKAMILKQETGKNANYVSELYRISKCHFEKGNIQLAFEYADRAILHAQKLGDEEYIAKAHVYKGFLFVDNNQLKDAKELIHFLEKSIKQLNNNSVNDAFLKLNTDFTSATLSFEKYIEEKTIRKLNLLKPTFTLDTKFIKESDLFLDSLKTSLKVVK